MACGLPTLAWHPEGEIQLPAKKPEWNRRPEPHGARDIWDVGFPGPVGLLIVDLLGVGTDCQGEA